MECILACSGARASLSLQPADAARCNSQVVLLEAGGNDFNNGTKPPGNWGAEYKRFLNQVNAHMLMVSSTLRAQASQGHSVG